MNWVDEWRMVVGGEHDHIQSDISSIVNFIDSDIWSDQWTVNILNKIH